MNASKSIIAFAQSISKKICQHHQNINRMSFRQISITSVTKVLGTNVNPNVAIPTTAYAVHSAASSFKLFPFARRAPREDDVLIRIHYCGICHTDIHQVKNEWNNSIYPMVPGHEISGVVEKVGSKVKDFEVGDHVGVGFMVDSCNHCDRCRMHAEQFCPDWSQTYNHYEMDKVTPTYGGFSNFITVRDRFVVKIPRNLPLDGAAPLLCAGITTYSPLRRFRVGENTKMAVVGLGGVGHMAVKFGVAMGAHVTVISTSESKRNDAIKLGAKDFIVSKDPEQLKTTTDSFNFILDTVSVNHDVSSMLNLLAFHGIYCVVGVPPKPIEIPAFTLLFKQPIITGSVIGGMKETQEMLDFCGIHGITSDIETIPMTPDSIEKAFDRTLKSDVKYRFVLDIKNAFQ